MATQAAGAVSEVPWGYNDEQQKLFVATFANGVGGNAGDTLTIQLPAEFTNSPVPGNDQPGQGWSIVEIQAEQWNSATAVGARVKQSVAIASISYSEATGLISCVLGAQSLAVTIGGVLFQGQIFVRLAPVL